MNNTNTTTSNPFAMGTVNLNTGTSTPAQPTNTLNSFNQSMVAPIQPATIPNSQSITTFGTQPINLPTQTPTQPAPILNPYQNIIDQTATTQTEAQKKEASVSQLMYDLAPKLEGKSAATIEAEKQAGVLDKTKAYNTLNSKVNMLDAEINQDDIKLAQGLQNIEDKPIAMEFITGQQQSVSRNAALARALKTSEKGVLIAQAQAALGDIELAKATAKQAVDARYSQYEDMMKTYETQLKALQPILTKDEKKQAREQTIKTNLALDEIKQKKEDANKANEMIINAMPFAPQGTTAQALKLAQSGASIVQVAQALGKYAGDYLGNMVKQSAIAENYAQINKINQEIKATQTQLPNNSLPGTSSYLYTTLANSAVNKDSLDATERQSVAKNLSVVDQLGNLQANISKQNSTGFIKGNVNNLLASIGQNADVGTINAQLQAIVPNLARGVYGEVGVLTDNDIANYRKTLPNLTSPKDQNDAVLALTLKAVQNNLKNTLVTSANSKKDVSRFIPQYNEVTQKINAINDRIGVNDVKVGDIVAKNPQAKPLVEALVKQGASGSQILEALGAD